MLDKVVKKKYELRDLHSQLKCHMNDFNTSICILKEILVSRSCRAKIGENQTQNYTIKMQVKLPAFQGV